MIGEVLENRAGDGSAAEFGRIFEANPEAMLVLDPAQDRVVDANPAACRTNLHRLLYELLVADS